MLNMKKGLALVLAAATAFTFAPVSTLGLTGVVEAQASLVGSAETKTISSLAKNETETGSAAFATAKGTGSDSSGIVGDYGQITVNKAETDKVTAEGSDSSIATEVKESSDKTSATVKYWLAKDATTGKKTVTIKGTHGSYTWTKTIDVTVTGPASHAPSFAGLTNGTLKLYGSTSGTTFTPGSAANVTMKFPSEIAGNKWYAVSVDTTIATIDKTADQTFTDADNDGKADDVKLIVTPKAKGNTKIYIYGNKDAADNDAARSKALASFTVDVNDYSLGVTPSSASLVAGGDPVEFDWTAASSGTGKFLTLTDADGDSALDDFYIYSGASGSAYLSSNYITGQTGAFRLQAKSSASGVYTLTLREGTASVTATITVSASGNGSQISTTTATSAYYGGVITNPIVTDGTSYSLIDSNAKVIYGGNVYQAGELTWYLTKDAGSTNPNNVVIGDAKAGSIASGAGKLDISVIKADNFVTATADTYVVGIAKNGGSNTLVYSKAFRPIASTATGGTKLYSKSVSISLADASTANKELLKDNDFLGVQLMGANNDYLTDDTTSLNGVSSQTAEHFSVVTSNTNNLKKSTLTVSNPAIVNGTYEETVFVPYTDTKNNVSFVAQIKLTVSVGEGPQITVRDGATVYGSTAGVKVASDPTIYLDLKTNKTFDVNKYLTSNIDGTTYAWSSSSANVDVKDGVITAKSAGYAEVYVEPTAAGVKGAKLTLYVRVNENPFDTLTVAGKDSSEATVLNYKQYTNNVTKLTSKAKLAAAQVKYVKIDVTGKETSDVKKELTVASANKATVTYSLEDANATKIGVKVNATTGEISIPHSYTTSDNFKPFSFAVKAVSAGTTTSANTTSYFYVVVDYKDIAVSNLQDTYEVGTSNTSAYSYLDFSNKKKVTITSGSVSASLLGKDDDLVDSNDYENDDATAFRYDGDTEVNGATVEGKTMHLLVTVTGNKQGTFYKVVTIKSVPGKTNYVTKIVNVADGKTIYEADGATSGAAITIDKKTVVKVTVAYAPDKTLNPKEDPAFTIGGAEDDFNHNTTNVFVAATENPKTYEITLTPSMEGTQVIMITPTVGRLSKSDYSIVENEELVLAAKYDASAATTKPAKVTGLKVSNKKGAKVTVKFNKVTTNATMRYYVQKKIGKKVSGKSVGSTKTTLSVAKGKTVKVRVKAYYYDENGQKHVGAYSAWKTLKTDKK